MNKFTSITREDIRLCVWSNSSVRCATAYRAAFGFLKNSGADIHAHKAMRTMMRHHAKDAIREARIYKEIYTSPYQPYTPSKPYTP